MKILIILIIIYFNFGFTHGQDVDIVAYLKQIESGNLDEVKSELPGLKKDYPNSPSVMFLEGVLTENGQEAVAIYNNIIKTYPHSKYADAALYRVYSYYYALGLYETARTNLDKLRKEYPNSPYIKLADSKIPSKKEISEKIPEKSPQMEEGKPVSDYKFTIQAGAFSKIDNAEGLKKDFQDSGFFSEIKDKVVGGTTFHVVYVGKFVDENEANNFLQVVNSEFNLDGRVVKME
jgi:tetratricopeptide (TPR) repeat protein